MYTTNPYATNNGTFNFGTTNNPAFGWNPAYANAGAGNGAFLGGGTPDCCGVTGFAGTWGNPFNAWNSANYGFGAWNGVNAFNANWNALFNGTPNINAQNLAAQNLAAQGYGPAFTGNPYATGFGNTAYGGTGFNATNGWIAPLPGWLTPNGFVPANAFGLRTGYAAPVFGNGTGSSAPTGFTGGTAANFATGQGGAVPGWFTPAQGFVTPNGSGTAAQATVAASGNTEYACSGTTAECGGTSNIKVRSVA